jgi:putative protease
LDDIDDIIKDEEEEKGKIGGAPNKNAVVEDMLQHNDFGDGVDAEDDVQSGAVLIGTVEHFFSKIDVAAVRLTGSLKIGDVVEVRGDGEPVRIRVSSMQIEKVDVTEAGEGDSVGIKVDTPITAGSKVYLIMEPGFDE